MIKKLQILFFLLILSVGNVFANNYYWVGGSGDWFDLSHWSSTSGGLGNAYGNSPTLNDNVFFNANSFLSAPLSLVSASQSITFHDMTWVSDITNHPKFYCQSNIDISGSITLLNQSIITFDINGSNTTFLSNFTENITYADQNFSTVTFNGNGTWNLVGTNQFYVDALLILIKGTFISNAKPVSCLRFISRPSNQNSPRILNIIGSTITIRSSDTYPLLSWDVENFANSIHVYSSGSTLNFNGVSGVSTIRAGCGLHYNDVNFNIDDGVVLACQDTFRNIRFYRIPSLNPNSKGNILGNSNVFNNVVFEGIGFIGDTTLNLIYSNSTYTNLDNKFNSVDIFHLGRVYGNHNVFNDLLFSTHPSYSGCSYNGNLDDGKLYGNNDTINNLLSFNREGTISGTHNNINLCTFMYDAWILNGSNKFDTINFNRQNLDDCSGCYYTYYRNDTLFLQNDSTQTITGALNLIGSIHCAHTFIKSYPLNQAANLYSIPNLSLDYVGLQNIHASNSLSVSDTARISLDLGGNSNWNFVNIYHEIIIDSIQIKNVHPCYNDANGEVTLFVNGGILPYKYGIWFPYYNSCYSPVTFNNNNTHSGLPKDTYHIRIQDAFECIKDSEVTISGPTEVKINSVIVQNIGCYTDSTGKITVNASGGTGNLSYSLDGYNFQTSPIFDKISLGTGVYSKFDSVYVRDDSLCTATKTYTLTQPHKLLLSFSGIVNNAIKCRGDSTGVVILIVNGGTPKYSFVIIGGNRNDTVKINSSQYDYNDPNSYPIKLLGGHYHCIVTDTNGCVHSTDFEIIEPDSIHISFDISKNKCYGDSTGSISATVTGASPPYQYLWTPGNYTTSTINNLAAGIYKLTVTDTNNCVYFKTDTLFSPLPITIKGRQDSVICYGQSNGSAIIDIDSINGGTAPYTIKWWNNGANIGNGYSLINKPAGVYIDSITDAHNCKIKDSITILQPPPFKTNIKIDTIICYGDSSGKAKVIASGETPPYSYKWESGLSVISTVDSIENVPSGTFRLIITDINGCDTSLFVFIPQHSKINATFQLGSSDCSSSAGSWTKVIASGGIPPYTYNWTGPVIGGGQGTDKITGLTSGKYYITIMDNDSCIHSDSVIISTLSSTITPNNGCAQMNNGSAKVTAIGGSTPYTYLWSTGATIDSVINLAPGLYWIVVTDSIHCTDSNTFVIDTVASLIDNIKKSDARCYGDNNGWAKVTSSGGAQPYFYQWSSLQAFNINAPFYDSIYNLKQGKYYVTINYNVYCNIKDSITIDQPPLLKIKIDSANIKCSEGDSTGWIKAIPIGGTSPYKYSWNTGDSTALIDSLPIGTYIVIVSDSNNCIATDTVKLSKPFLAFLHKDIDCNGDSTGWIKAIPSGGTRPYHYNWTSLQTFNPTTPALTVDSIYNLKVGKYFLTMTDSLDCSLRDSVEITQNDSIKISFDVSPNKCFGDSTASVQATVTGGIRFTNNTYHYLWSNGRTTSRIDSLVAKTYILTVTDSLGCVMIDSITVNQPPKLGDSIIYSNDSCFGDQNGWAKVYPIGGRSPYIFLWSPTSVSPNPYVNQIYNLKAGNYFITITDSSGYCTYLDTVLITQPTELLDSIFSDSVSCFGFLDGRAWVRPSGGTPPYHYLWNDITNSTNDTIFNLTSRYYKVTITDSLGCTKTDSILVKQPTELLVVKDSINVNCHDSLTGFARVTPSGGTTPYTYLWSNGAISNSINNLPFGVYWVIVKDKNYCKADTIFFNITQNTQIAFNAAPDTTVCYNTSAKLRIDNPSGGVFPYQVNWNPPNSGFTPTLTLTTSALTNPTNIFIATLKDSKGCEVKDTLTVKVNPQITITTNGNKTICKKDTVWLNVNVNGGLPFSNNTYHYSWDNCATLSNCFIKNPVANPIVTTTYKVTVTDSSGCTASASITVTVKPLPVPVFSSNVVCFGGTTLFANSSTPPAGYSNSYVWDFNDPPTPSSAINPTHTFTHPGTFSVLLTATDNSLYSCHDTVSHLVIVDSLPTTNFTFNNPCLGQTTQFNNLTSANSASFNSFWKFLDDGTQSIDKNPYHFYPVAGTYPVKLIVTNIKGCTDSVQKNVTVNALPVADFTADSLCFPGCAHILSTSTATMSKIDSLKWYFGDGTETPYDTTKNPVHCYNNAGIYYITLLVTDTNNCLGSKTKELKIIPAPYANFASTRVCFGDTTQFTDLSSSTFDTISSRIWYFGDDSSSTAKNPKHSYGHPGKFIVSLKIINQSNCYDSVAKEVFVDSLPVAHFYADTVCLGNETHFTDSSESHGSPNNSWLWEFGDGNSAYYHNAAYPFDSASTYYTRLIVTNHRGCKDTVEKPVVVYPLPIANFTYTGTCLNDTSYFYSTSVSNAADNNFTYLWTFGDGDSSVLKNPFHIYLLAGSYNVKLKITNSNACSKDTILKILIHPLPDIHFTYLQSCLHDTTIFNNQTNGNGAFITNWLWKFGDDSTSVLKDPSHLYLTADTFNLQLIAMDQYGCRDTLFAPVAVDSLPIANFVYADTCLSMPTRFTDLSQRQGSDNNNWQWEFGDLIQASYQHPFHTYTDPAIYLYNVKLTVTNAMGCKDDTIRPVIVNPLPQANFNFTGICHKSITQFNSNPATTNIGTTIVSYLWNFGDGIDSISELPNPVHIYALPGNYSVSLTITNSNGCVDDTMIMITINPLPDVHFSYSQTCLNLNTQFTNQTVHPTNIANWLWKFGDNSTSIQMNPAHKYPAADTFNAKLIATDDLGCSDSLTLAVIIDSLPVAKFKTDTVCLNDATYFTDLSESHGSAINFWHWEFGDGDTAFFQHPNHSYLNPQIYNAQLIVVNTMGCSDTISQSVKIDSLPFANFIYQDTCYNSPTHFYSTSTAQSGILASYSWDFGDGITSNLPNPIHIFNAPGSYYVKLTVTNFIAADSNYCSDDTIILITIYPLPDVHFSYSQTCLNQNTQFINQTNHPTNIGNWLWRFGDNSTSIQANPIHSYLTANTFNVKLIVIDDLGCKDSISQPVIVDSLPVANFVYADTCLNMPTLFTDLSQHHGSNNVSWLWDFDGISQANIQNPSHTFTNPTQYNYNVKLTVSNAMGCKDDTIKQIIVNHIPLADFYFLDTICQLDTLELTDLSTVTASHINKWEWDFGDGGTSTLQHPKHHYQSYGIFYISLTVTDTNGCTDNVMKQLHVVPSPSANFAYTRVCFGDTTFFNDLSSYIYDTINSWDWDFGDGSQHSNLKNPKHFFSTPKTYQVSLSITSSNSDSLYLCRDKIVKNVVVDSLPKANFYTDTVCLKNSVQYHDSSLSHGSANNYWHWTFSDSINIFTQHPVHTFLNDTATHVKLLVVNQMGCKDSISKKVYLNPLPYANFKFSNNPGTCFNDTTCFNSSPWSTTSPGTTLISWLWHFGDGDTSTLQNPCHVYNTSGTYFVKLQITNSNHCQKDTIIKLIISPLQKIMFTYSQTCLGDSTQFTNLTFSNIPIIKFKWNFGDNHYDSTNWNPKHYYTLAKKYNVILSVTDTNLCTAQKIIEIEVDSLPVAHFDFDTVCMNSGTQFTDKSEHHGSVNNLWHWSFDDGSISLIQHPNHAYSYIYPYIATLIVGNQKGCTDTVSHHIVFKTQPVNFTHENTCLHDFTQFTFTNLGYASPVVSWLWNFGDGIDSTSTLKNPKHVYAVPGTYLVRLTIMNADSCLSDTTIAVIIYPTPEVNFSYSQACLHDSTHFVNLTNSVLLVETVKWTFTPFNTILNINNPSFQFSNPGFNPVTLQITDTLGCTAYKTDTVVVDSLPVARFITDTACFNSATSFIDTSEWHGSPNISWYWQFGDGNAAYYHDVLYPYNAAGVYNATLIVTNAKNCKDTVIQQVYVNHPMNVANFILSDTCMGDTTHFTSLSSTSPGTTITKYTWNFGDGTIKITNAVNISHFFHFPGNYYVKLTITNSFGCSKDTIIKVSIRPLPEIHFNYIRGCLGDPTRFINLSDTNHIPYWKWIYGDNYHATNVISPVYKYQLAGVYDVTLIGIDSFGCMDSLTLPINVDTLPIANFKFDSICFHDVTHFTDLSVSYGGDITDWYWDFGDGSFSFFQHPGHQFDSPGTYNVKLIITNIRGCNDTIVKQVKIDSIPIANFTYIKHCLNDITQFHSSAITQTSSTILNYSWDFGDGSGIWNSVYPDFNHQYQFPGTYYVKHTVFNSNHCTDDTTIVVTIYPLPNLFLWHTQTCMGDTTQFVNLSDTIPYNITKWKWIFGDGSIDSIKNPLHLYPPPQYSYNLSLIGIDVNGCSDTISETFKIDSLPIANFTSNKACLHNDTYFTDLSTIGNGSPIVDWHWYFGDGDSAFYQHPQHQYPNSGTYMDTLEVINLMGCKDKIIKPLTINPLPVVNFTDTNLCINDVTKFHSTSTSPGSSILSYTWDFGDGSPVISAISQNITHPYSSPGYYWVRLTVVNADSCINDTVIKIKIHSLPELGFNYTQTCLGDPTHFINLTIHDTLMSSWVWNFNNPPSPGSNTMNPTHTFSNAGTYFVNLIGKDTIGCSNSITLPVKVDSLPHADFSSDINCLHGETHFTDLSTIGFGDSIVDWHWYFGDGDSSFYQHPSHQYPFLNTYQAKLKVINMMGCADSVEKHVIIRPLPIPHFTWKDTCYKQITIFNSITSTTRPGTYITSYIWDFGDGTPLINTPSPVQSHEYLLAGSYLVKLSIINSVDSCSNDTSFMVTIHDLPDVHFNYSQTCLGDLMHFYNLTNLTNSDTNSCSWKWNFGEPSPSTLKNPAHKYQYATSYPVKLIATNSFGCIDSLTQAVKVDSLPFANFTTDIACLHNETHFTDISIGYGSPINDWHWHFSDGDSSSYQHPSHQFPGSGTFNDTLIVINIMGCTDTVVKPVIIRPLPIANFTWSDTTCYNNTTFFTSTSTSRPGTYIDSYYWDFGDGHTTSTNNPYQPIFNNYSLPGSYLVKLTITNFPDACSNDTSFVVTIHPLPDIHYVYTQTCLHDSTHFINLTPNPDSINNWKWIFGDGSPSLITSVFKDTTSHLYLTARTFNTKLIATTLYGCMDSLSVSVKVDSLPKAKFTSDSICLHNATQFTDLSTIGNGSPIAEWNWHFGDGDTASYQHPAHLYDNPGNYIAKLLVINVMGCKDSITDTVKVRPLPIPMFTWKDSCYTDSTHFTSISITNAGSNFINKWYFDDGDSLITTSSIVAHKYLLPGTYYVKLIVQNSYGCKNDTTIKITIHDLPDVHFNYSQACLGDPTHFFNLTNSTVPITKWLWNLGNGIGSCVHFDTIYKYTIAKTYNVTLTVTDTNACISSLTKPVIVDSLPTANFTTTRVCLNDSTHFADLSISHGSPNNYWHWEFGDGDTAFFRHPNHAYPNSQNYNARLIVKNIMGCWDDTTIVVKIDSLPVAKFTFSDTCYKDSTRFYSSVSIPNSIPKTIVSYLWDFGDNDTSILKNPIHRYALPGDYPVKLRVTNINGCHKDTLIWVRIHPLPFVNFNYSQTCIGGITHFYNLTVHDTIIKKWIWSFGDGPPLLYSSIRDTAHKYLAAGNFNVRLIARDTLGCIDTLIKTIIIDSLPVARFKADTVCYLDETHFTDLSIPHGSPVIDWHWKFGDGDSAFSQNPHHQYPHPGTYQVTLKVFNINGCYDSTIKTVLVRPLPVANFAWKDTCFTDSTHFYSTSTSMSGIAYYKWVFDDGDSIITNKDTIAHKFLLPGSYWVQLTVKNSDSCQKDTTIFITIHDLPDIHFNYSQACLGDSMHFYNLTVHDTAINQWIWNFGDGPPLLNSSIRDTAHLYQTAGTFDVKLFAKDVFGCTDSLLKQVVVDSLPTANFSLDPACLNIETHFIDLSSPNGDSIIDWHWYFGDGDSANYQNPHHIYHNLGTDSVKLIITNFRGCKDTINSEIIVHTLPNADFTSTPNLYSQIGFFVSFKDLSTVLPGDILSQWKWNFGEIDLLDDTTQNPGLQKFTIPGSHLITLVVKNQWGCPDTAQRDMIILGNNGFFAPNAFTPDQDQLDRNEIFIPDGTFRKDGTFEMYIYNRWGQQVFETHTYKGWDGKFKNEYCMNEVYVWLVRYIDINGDHKTAKGIVTLIR